MSEHDPHILYVELRKGNIMPVFMGNWDGLCWIKSNILIYDGESDTAGWRFTPEMVEFLCASKFEQRRGNTNMVWARPYAAVSAMRFTPEEAVRFKFLFDSGA